MKHLFAHQRKIFQRLKDKNILLLLDYDGTLTPIVRDPKNAVLHEEKRDLLKMLAGNNRCRTAVITGRGIKDIKGLVGLKNIIYSGNHGLVLKGPGICFKSPISNAYLQLIKRIKKSLKAGLTPVRRIKIEDKGISLSVHYRLVRKNRIQLAKKLFQNIIAGYLAEHKIKVKTGKKIFEIGPPVEWDKGKIVLWLLKRHKNYIPVYIGDDITDEDAFKALRNVGLTVIVGISKKSHAEYFLRNTTEVKEFLKQILEVLENKSI